MTKTAMSGDSKFFLGVVVVAILIIGGVIFYSTKHPSGASISNVDVANAQKIGPDNAKVRIIEFGDFECPACAAAASGVRAVQANNTDVQLIFKNFPLLSIHKNAQISSQAGVAAANQGKFWELYDALYANQAQWQDNSDPTPHFISYAKTIGIDTAKFTIDMNSDASKKLVTDDYNYAISLGMNETPTFVVNGTKYTGVQTADQWSKILETARK